MTELDGRRLADGSLDQTLLVDPAGGNVLMSDVGLPADDAGLQIVFIDGSLPDAQTLASGVKAGVLAVLLDPSLDGVQQIADYLTVHNLQNLAAIDIVGHGANGEMQLGSALLSAATIGDHQSQLAQIGAALQPGGDILLYGCDVAQDATGDAFLQQLSQAAGGANIAAASHLVGAAAQGGSFTLDVNVGSIDVSTPFTTDAVANVSGEFALTSDQVFVSLFTGNSNDATGFNAANRVQQISVNGSNAATNPINVANGHQNGNTLSLLGGIAVDAPLQEFFVVNQPVSTGIGNWGLFEGSVTSGTGSVTEIYVAPDDANADTINGLAIDQPNGLIYFVQNAFDNANGTIIPGQTGIFKISVGATLGTAATAVATGSLVPLNLSLDLKDNLVFFTETDFVGAGLGGVNNLDVANLSTGTITTLVSEPFANDGSGGNGGRLMSGVAVDPNSSTVYFTTQSENAANYGIFSAHFTVAGSGNTAQISNFGTVGTLYSGSGAFDPADIAIDPHNGIFYVAGTVPDTVPDGAGGSMSGQVAGVFEGSLSHSGAGSLTQVFSMTSVLPDVLNNAPGPSFDSAAPNLFLESTPTVTTSGTVTYLQGGAAQTIDQTTTVTNSDGQELASATVAIVGFASGDTLSANTTGTAIISNYNTATGTLTLTGVDTVADYQGVLDTITFSTTSTASTSHIIDWTVSDGIITSPTSTTTVNVHAKPIVTAGTTVSFTGGGGALLLDSGLTVTNVFGTVLASGTVTIGGSVTGDTLSFTNTSSSTEGNIVESSFNSGVLVLTSSGNSATVAQWQTALRSVSYSFTPGGDPTGGGSHTSHTISWVVNDGVISSASANSTLNVVHVAPSITATGTVSFTGGSSPVTLDNGLTVTDPDSAGNLTSATVVIGGFISGDTLTVGSPGSLTPGFSNGTLTLTGTASIATYQAALDSVQYSYTAGGDPTGGGLQNSRTISWFANDGVSNSNTATSTLNLIHAAPSITASGTVSFTGGGLPVTLDNGLTVTDPDSAGNLTGATVIIGGFISGDTLTVGTPGGLTPSFSNGTLTLSGTASIATYQAALDSVQYGFAAGGDPTGGSAHATTRTISWFVNDGVSTSGTVTTALNIQHAAAIVTAGTTVSYVQDGAPIPLDAGLTVSDPDSGDMLTGATVSISSGFLSGDTLNFTAQNGISGSQVNGVLTLTGTATVENYQAALQSITYSFSGDPTNGGTDTSRTISWIVNDGVANSGAATSTLNLQAACYLAGTRICTSRGEVAVEDLRSDDMVLTVGGAYRPLVWLGYRRVDCTRHRAPQNVWPIRIVRHAVAPGLPARDLYLSPDHALYFDQMLIPVKYLVNGTTIAQVKMAKLVYYHVELDRHDVLLAEGLPAETYLDTGDRSIFENGGGPIALYPDFASRVWEAEGYAPLVIVDQALASIRQKLSQRAELLEQSKQPMAGTGTR